MTTYDEWKTTNPADHELGPEPPPCERNYAGFMHQHPRFPSGYCVECGAQAHEGCKHEYYQHWEEFQAGAEAEEEQSLDYFNHYIAGDR